MSGVDDAGAGSRHEAWIDAAGLAPGEARRAVDAVLATGVPASHVRLVVQASAEVALDDARAAASETGAALLDGDPASLDGRLAATDAGVLVFVRAGRVVPEAFARIDGFLDRFPHVDAVYGDSVTEAGEPLLRPVDSPIRLLGNDFLGPVVAVRTEVLRRLGGFRPDARRAQVLDVALRLRRAGARLALVPEVLATEDVIHDDYAGTSDAQRRVVEHDLEERGVAAEVEDVEPFLRRVRFDVAESPLVSVVIPTRGSSADIGGVDRVLVVEAVRGVIEGSTYRNVEVVVVADRETPAPVIEELERICGDRLRLVLWDAPFNFSGKMNRGAAAARGEYLLLLNDDVEIVTPDWIEALLGPAQQPEVGIVGAQLYFEDSTLQHSGQVYTGGVAGHAAFGWEGGRDDSIRSLSVDHEVSGVTAACALMRRDLFLEVGGFSLAFPGNYNDVDLNMKVRATGRSAVFTPWARLYHFESKTRDPKILDTDISTLQARWARRMQVELYSRML
ncbi:glycosyltransferase family 2 protein [Agromyces sp. SYSU T0242]|uniref:glycosyltransferase family 2 protein n=1 Tax=Agromyces litoreus TaxID=3158561 RepID=UPI0033998449